MVTAETITREQILALNFADADPMTRHKCALALGHYGTEFERRRARQLGAEILNARARKET